MSEEYSVLWMRYCDQGGRCYYCLRQTWLEGSEEPKKASKRLHVPIGFHLDQLRATREHLKRKVDGGSFDPENIVMACWQCNTDRGERSVLDHVKAKRQRYQIADMAPMAPKMLSGPILAALRRAKTAATTTFSIGGREKTGRSRAQPITLPALERIQARERARKGPGEKS